MRGWTEMARLVGDGAEDEVLEGGNCSLKESPPPTGGVGPGGGFSSPAASPLDTAGEAGQMSNEHRTH